MKLIIISNPTQTQMDLLVGEFPCISEGNKMVIPFSLYEHFFFQLELVPILNDLKFNIVEI